MEIVVEDYTPVVSKHITVNNIDSNILREQNYGDSSYGLEDQDVIREEENEESGSQSQYLDFTSSCISNLHSQILTQDLDISLSALRKDEEVNKM